MESPLTQIGQVAQLKSLLQEQQFRQQQMASEQQMQPLRLQQAQNVLTEQQQKIQDTKAGQAAWNDWDGKDYTDLAHLIIAHGGSLQSAQQVAQFGLDSLVKHSTILKNEGEGAAAKATAMKTNADQQAGYFDALNNLPDNQLQQAFIQTVQDGLQSGRIDPAHAQLAQQIGQLPPDQIRTHLPLIVKSYTSESQQIENALKVTQTAKAQAEIPGAAAESQLKQAQQQAYQQWAALPRNQNKNYNDFLAEQAAIKSGAEAKARLPYEETLVSYNKNAAMGNMLAEHALNTVSDMFVNPQHGYSQTLSQLNATKTAIANAQNGDQLAASLAPLMTALGIVSYANIHRINQYDINAAGPEVGSVLRQIDAKLAKMGSGSLAAGTASEMSGLMDNLLDAKHRAVIQGARVAAANGGIDPSKVAVMDKQGNLVRLSDVAKQTPGSGGGPQVGDVKTYNGRNYKFDGNKWVGQ
jgi:hypothetical protein